MAFALHLISMLAWAHPIVREWFVEKFGTPTEPQEQGWPHILAGRDTLISARRAMLQRPPHILVTTPESLYILLTAEKSRQILRTVDTVIVDEIHAVADDMRGSHLTLSLERLDALVGRPVPRIGLSATQKPIEVVGQFLCLAARRGRYGAHLHHDRVNRRLKARRGGRLAAITGGGAIPETALYTVVAEPEGATVGTVDEDFAVESLAGDIMLLGNTSWRIRRVSQGRVMVEDAHGAAPSRRSSTSPPVARCSA